MEPPPVKSTSKSIERGFQRLFYYALLLTLLLSFVGAAYAEAEESGKWLDLSSSSPESSSQDLVHAAADHEKNLEVCAQTQYAPLVTLY